MGFAATTKKTTNLKKLSNVRVREPAARTRNPKFHPAPRYRKCGSLRTGRDTPAEISRQSVVTKRRFARTVVRSPVHVVPLLRAEPARACGNGVRTERWERLQAGLRIFFSGGFISYERTCTNERTGSCSDPSRPVCEAKQAETPMFQKPLC